MEKGGGEGEGRRGFFSPPTPSSTLIFALVTSFSIKTRGNACYSGYMLPYTETGALHKDGSKEWGDILALPNNLSLENLAAAQTLSPIIKILEKK